MSLYAKLLCRLKYLVVAKTKFLLTLFVVLFSTLFLSACETTPATIPMGEGATVDADGLHKVDHGRAAVIFVDPKADFSAYSKFYLKGSLPVFYRNSNQYELNDVEHARVLKLYQDAFAKALTDIGLTQTDAPGDDVLVIKAALDKVLVNARPEPSGRNRVYVESTGYMTLLLQVSGGVDKTPLIRFAEGRRAGSLVRRSTSVTVNADLSRVFNHWAGRLANGLTLSPQEFKVFDEE